MPFYYVVTYLGESLYGLSCKILLYIILVRSLWQIFKLGRNVHSKYNVRHIILFIKKFLQYDKKCVFYEIFSNMIGFTMITVIFVQIRVVLPTFDEVFCTDVISKINKIVKCNSVMSKLF